MQQPTSPTKAEAGTALIAAADAAKEEATLANRTAEALAREKKELEAELKAAEDEAEFQFQDHQQTISRYNDLEELEAVTKEKLAASQDELVTCRS